MRWYRARTYTRAVTGADALGVEQTELAESGSILVRTAPWSASENAVEGNAFHSIRRTFLTKAAPSLLDGIEAIEVQGALWGVDAVNHGAGTTAISAERFKEEA